MGRRSSARAPRARWAWDDGRWRGPTPIGFYFAKLWYSEQHYPLVLLAGVPGLQQQGRVDLGVFRSGVDDRGRP